jgi:hypothetical protein
LLINGPGLLGAFNHQSEIYNQKSSVTPFYRGNGVAQEAIYPQRARFGGLAVQKLMDH